MPQITPARHSCYYPPRARRNRAPRRLFNSLRAAIHLERIHLPRLHGFWRMLAAAMIPGLAFHFNGPRIAAKLIWGAVPVLLLVFLAALGTFLAEVAFGLLIAAHAISVSHLLRPLMVRCRLLLQLVFGVVLFMAMSLLFYNPARGWFHDHVAMPLELHGQTVVINPRSSAMGVQRGDWVAYRIPAGGGRGVVVREGMGLRPVWGLPGDKVVFGNETIFINDQHRPLRGSRQTWKAEVVPEESWFIWPELSISNRGRAQLEVANTLRNLAVVPQNRFVGRAYEWWFFRTQGSL